MWPIEHAAIHHKEILMRLLIELIAVMTGIGLRNWKAVCVFLFALSFSVIMLGVLSKYGSMPVPYPLLFVLIGTVFIITNWK